MWYPPCLIRCSEVYKTKAKACKGPYSRVARKAVGCQVYPLLVEFHQLQSVQYSHFSNLLGNLAVTTVVTTVGFDYEYH